MMSFGMAVAWVLSLLMALFIESMMARIPGKPVHTAIIRCVQWVYPRAFVYEYAEEPDGHGTDDEDDE